MPRPWAATVAAWSCWMACDSYSAEAAGQLAQTRESLCLNGLPTRSEAVAKAPAPHTHTMSLFGPQGASPEAACRTGDGAAGTPKEEGKKPHPALGEGGPPIDRDTEEFQPARAANQDRGSSPQQDHQAIAFARWMESADHRPALMRPPRPRRKRHSRQSWGLGASHPKRQRLSAHGAWADPVPAVAFRRIMEGQIWPVAAGCESRTRCEGHLQGPPSPRQSRKNGGTERL